MKNKMTRSRKTLFMAGIFLLMFSQLSCQLTTKASEYASEIANSVVETVSAQTGTSEQYSGDVYTNEEYGFSITIPNGIAANTPESGMGYFQDYVMGDSEGFGWLFPNSISSDETLQEVGEQVFISESSWLSDVEVLKDEEITLPQGGSAWYTEFQGYDEGNEYTVEIRMTTVIHAMQSFTLEIYSLPELYTYWNSKVNAMRDSITLFSPAIEGHPRSEVLMLEGGETTNARENDPATMHSGGNYLVFEGLVSYNEDMEIVPALAESWDISNGTVYTFHLQPNAVFHDGKAFTAEDVVYSWQRAADPETNSDTVMTYLGDIVGVKEMHEGSANTISGLKIIDDHTLQVTIDASKPYFLYKITYPTAYILDRENVESDEEWYRSPNGTGPYKLVTWISMERMVYERFEDYYGVIPAIPTIIYTLYTGIDFRLYEEGSVDIATVADYNIDRVSDPSEPLNKELVSGVSMCTTYIQFDVNQPPFDDVKVRQAFSMAFDKEKFLDIVLQNTDVIAKGLYPPALPGYNLDLEGYDYDPEMARQLIKESKYGSVDAFPEIVFTSSGYGSYANSLVSAISDMWQKNLGVTISIENIDPEKYLDQEAVEEYGQLTSSGWCADYPDPENFADVLFHSEATMNKSHYSNPELDAILEEARVEQDVDKRISLYQQAEEIIVEDAPALFLYHSTTNQVVKPYIKGYILSPISGFPTIRFLSIDPSYWE